MTAGGWIEHGAGYSSGYDLRLPKVVFTKECSLGEIGSGSLDKRRRDGECVMIDSNLGR